MKNYVDILFDNGTSRSLEFKNEEYAREFFRELRELKTKGHDKIITPQNCPNVFFNSKNVVCASVFEPQPNAQQQILLKHANAAEKMAKAMEKKTNDDFPGEEWKRGYDE